MGRLLLEAAAGVRGHEALRGGSVAIRAARRPDRRASGRAGAPTGTGGGQRPWLGRQHEQAMGPAERPPGGRRLTTDALMAVCAERDRMTAVLRHVSAVSILQSAAAVCVTT